MAISGKLYAKLKKLAQLLVLSLAVFLACEPDTPINIIPEPEYIKLAAELQLSRAYLQVTRDTIAYLTLNESLFKKYDYSTAQFDSSHTFYEKDFEAQLQRYQQVRDYIRYLEQGPLKLVNPILMPDFDSTSVSKR